MRAEKKQAKRGGEDRLRGKRVALWRAIETWATAIYGERVLVPADPAAAEVAVGDVERIFACERCGEPGSLVLGDNQILCESCWHPAYLGWSVRNQETTEAGVLDSVVIREAIAQLIEERCRAEEHPADCECAIGARGVRGGLGFTFSIASEREGLFHSYSKHTDPVATAFEPVREWYEGEGDRSLAEMLTDAVADLQRDRSVLGEILEARRLVKEHGPGHAFDLEQALDRAAQGRDKNAELAEAYGLGDALTRIRSERTRQVEEKGWDAAHDDQHTDGSLAFAACNYAMPERCRDLVARVWPWDATWWNPTPGDRVRELTKAGALIVAEIERIRRGMAAERERERQARFDGRHQ